MRNCSAEKESRATSKTLITSFLPRQVLLNSNFSSTNMNPIKEKTLQKCEQKGVLLQSISQFLERNGFLKTLKYFLKEAQFEKDEGGSVIDIEEVCYEFLKSRNGVKDEQGTKQTVDASVKDCEETKENGGNEGKKSEPPTENGAEEGANVKSKKKKKKSKTADDASEQVVEETQSKPAEVPEEVPAKKSKDKKKKHKDNKEHMDEDLKEKKPEVATDNVEKKERKEKKEKKAKKEKDGSKKKEENVPDPSGPSNGTIEAGEENKVSKKRKKPSSEENDAGNVEEVTLDDSKRRKTDNSDKSNEISESLKTSNGSANGVLEQDGSQKSQKQEKIKENNGSAEPKTTSAKAFQRVKPEEVEFADERLQDNSYWAKGGADSGYGAKAQEVLGQVRGRDFRHEKTKKKRGSYRGGVIDLNTHSVKFNYDDDDE